MTTPTTPGLRERKKARTRWAIQEHALRLFAEQGYEATTIDQIAAAAEISPSTFFRYFATKEDVVVQDEFDEQLIEAFRAAGASTDPVRALRDAMVRSFEGMDDAEREKGRQRTELTLAVPALRARTFDNVMTSFEDAVAAFVEGAGRPSDDLTARCFVAAVIGAALPVLFRWVESGYVEDVAELFEAAMTGLREMLASG